MKRKPENRIIKNLSKRSWKNPNCFNATSAVLADIAALLSFVAAGLLLLPFVGPLKRIKGGTGIFLCLSTVLTQGMIFLTAFLFCKIRGVRLFGGGIRFRLGETSWVPAIILLTGTVLLLSPAHMEFTDRLDDVQKALFGKSSLDALANMSPEMTDMPFVFILMLIFAPLLPAICEEALFRGVVMNGLREFGTLFAIFVSGLLFALMHGNHMQLILQFTVGCEIAFVVIATNNYFAGCIMHFFNNFFNICLEFLTEFMKGFSPVLENLFNASLILMGVLLLCIAVIYYVKLYRFKQAPKYDRFGNEINGKFPFYRDNEEKGPCCLLQKGYPEECCFSVDIRTVKTKDNSGMLYFYNKKFRSFSKRSNKTVFYLLLALAVLLSAATIFLNFII